MIRRLLLSGALLSLLAGTAMAGSGATAIGPRMGFSVDPDQLVLGGQLVIGDIAPSLTFEPNLEMGFGDNRTVIGVSFDFHYHLLLRSSEWQPYLGGGVGIHFTDRDRDAGGGSDSNVGGNVIVGVGVPTRTGSRFFSEMKLGLGDIPSLKILAGWNFPM